MSVHQGLHRKPGGGQQSSHNTLSPFMKRHAYKGFSGDGVHYGEIVNCCWAIVQLEARSKRLAQPARNRPGHRRQVGLGHLERGVHQTVSQFAVIGQQQQSLGVGVEPPDVKQLLVAADPMLDEIADTRSSAVVGHRRVHARGLLIAR